jgi:MYXO-CTERM domain-containing protein
VIRVRCWSSQARSASPWRAQVPLLALALALLRRRRRQAARVSLRLP